MSEMSLRTNYALKSKNPSSRKDLQRAIDLIIAEVGGSIVYFDKARKFIE